MTTNNMSPISGIVEILANLGAIVDTRLAIRVLSDEPAPPASTVAVHVASCLGWLFGASFENSEPRRAARAELMAELGLSSPASVAAFSQAAIQAGLERSAEDEVHRTEAFAEWWRGAIEGSREWAGERNMDGQERVAMLAQSAGPELMKKAAQGIMATHLVSLSHSPGRDKAYGAVEGWAQGGRGAGGWHFQFDQHFAGMLAACRANPNIHVSTECLRGAEALAEAAHQSSGSDENFGWDERVAELMAVKEQSLLEESTQKGSVRPRPASL